MEKSAFLSQHREWECCFQKYLDKRRYHWCSLRSPPLLCGDASVFRRCIKSLLTPNCRFDGLSLKFETASTISSKSARQLLEQSATHTPPFWEKPQISSITTHIPSRCVHTCASGNGALPAASQEDERLLRAIFFPLQ